MPAKKKAPPKKKGPASRYTEALGNKICRRLEGGESLRQVCRSPGMPDERTVRRWAMQPDHPFAPQYARAREVGYLSLADELLEISDDGSNDWMRREGRDNGEAWALNGDHIQRSRLRVDSRKWLLSKMLPKVFGDPKQQLELSGIDGGPIEVENRSDLDIARRLGFLLSKASDDAS